MRSVTAVARQLTVGALIALAGGAVVAQQAYPSKTIRFIVPYAPGGSTNILARLVGQKLSDIWGQPVVVDNRPGGNTIIGSEILVKSAPDGYTILLVGNTHVVMSSIVSTPYDAIKDFAPVATVVSNETIMALNPSVPAKNLQELISLAKSRPGQLNHASSGVGTLAHLGIELFNIMTGTKIVNVPYKGSGQVLVDLIGGQVQLGLNTPINLIPHIRSGKLRGIAVTGASRLSALPELPTFGEAGLAGFDVKYWYGILAPAGTRQAVIDKLSAEIAKIMAAPDTREKLQSQGMEPFISKPEQFAALMKADKAKYAKIIKTANIKIEN